MATESPIMMLESEDSTKWLPFSNLASNEAINKVLNDNFVLEKQTRIVPNRSGSAPPTVEGSIAAFRAFMEQRNLTSISSSNQFLECESEEQMRTDPSYIAYYYANVKMNPRLPPPLISRENCDFVRFMGAFGGKKVLPVEGLMATHKEEFEETESLCKIDGDQKESFVDGAKITSLSGVNGNVSSLMEGDFIQGTTTNQENDHNIQTISTTDQIREVQDSPSVSIDSCTLTCSTSFPISTTNPASQNVELEDNASIQSNVGSDVSVVESRMKLLDVRGELRRDNDQNRHDSFFPPSNIQKRVLIHPSQDMTYQLHGYQGYSIPRGTYAIHHQLLMPNPGLNPPLYASTTPYMNPGNHVYPPVPQSGFPSAQFGLGGYCVNPMFPPHYGKYLTDNQFPIPIDAYSHKSFVKQAPLQGQYFRPSFEDSQRSAQDINLSSTIEKLGISSTNGPHISATYYGYTPNFVLPGATISRNLYQGLGNDPTNSPKSTAGSSRLNLQKGPPESSDNSKLQSFLELLKSSSSRTFGLSDISGQIVEFSTDQHGSRFIQQKLENCSSEEKESVFKEVLPQSSKLMTDVFGNYVVQKFFEHGTAEQRRMLGEQISGQVLTLSLQMYGCRVIQKALEVIELDQKVKLVKELDGHVMRCVHDQNGNHVIQKCIESVPTNEIKFIILSFSRQVATLSCHPYGCRVIQRVLEHCSDEKITEWIVDEVLESTSVLAKDPYGNYVIQHILEMGKPEQRSQIIDKLKGQFVQLSQHKFASNVVEKCLKFGNVSEQDCIAEEVIARSETDEVLLVMMKDQFANYVVQRIFEIGSEKQKDTLRNCIRLHLPLLKKVAYAKHIVSRYEQLEESSEQEQIKPSAKTDNNIPSISE